jgi:uncharacterized protein (DUF924 family)
MSNGVYSKLPVAEAGELLDFWFGDPSDTADVEERRKLWFSSTKAQDLEMRERFGALHERAVRGNLDDWMAWPRTALALILLLDQLTRNLYRGTARAFANDEQALARSGESIDRGFDSELYVPERTFLYMPFQHSEDLDIQRRGLALFGALAKDAPPSFGGYVKNVYDHAVLHHDLVKRFGRFPHRNKLLARPSTEGEREYLEQGGQRFGQG